MPKFIPTFVTNILGNPASAAATINSNLTRIAEEIEETLSRFGVAPNQMQDVLDMNHNRIINLPEAVDDSEPVRLGDMEEIVVGLVDDIKEGPPGEQGPPGQDGVSTTMVPFSFTGDGTAGPFALPSVPATNTHVLLFLSGVGQVPVVDYTIIGDDLTFEDTSINGASYHGVIFTALSVAGSIPASAITYDNDSSGLSATDVQLALDEIAGSLAFVTPEMFGAVGNGIANDSQAVLDAATEAEALGVPLRLVNTYLFNDATLFAWDGARIYGPGRLVKNINEWTFDSPTANTGTGNYYSDDHFIRVQAVDNVVIDGVEFLNTNDASRRYAVTVEESTKVKILNCRSLGTETFCFIFRLSSQVEVRGNISVGGGAFGIATGGEYPNLNTDGVVSDIIVTGNYFADADSESLDVNWDTQTLLFTNNTTFNNNIRNGEEDIDIGGGVCSNIRITNNVINLNAKAQRAIYVKSDGVDIFTSDILVEGNSVINGIGTGGTNNTALYVLGPATARVQILNNAIRGGFTHAVSVVNGAHDVLIQGNVASSLVSRAVYTVLGGGTAPYNINIIGNIFDGTSANNAGLDFVDGTRITVKGNKINGFATNGITFSANITIYSAEDNEITGCTLAGISALGRNGILNNNRCWLNGRNGITVQTSDVVCNNNILWNNSQQGAGLYYNLQLVTGSNFVIMSGNKCYDDQGTKTSEGFRVSGACDRCVIIGNIFYGNRATNYTGTANLTNSVFSTAENVVA